MKRLVGLFLTAIMISVLFCIPAIAEESSPHRLSGTVLFGSNYYWRGYTQTDNDPNVQGSIDYEHSSGFYAGIWGSNVANDQEYVNDFDTWEYKTDNADIEIDFWAGYWREIGPL